MKALPFMVSVQWGAGHHYFWPEGAATLSAAEKIAEAVYNRSEQTVKKNKGRGAKPSVMVWQLRQFKKKRDYRYYAAGDSI